VSERVLEDNWNVAAARLRPARWLVSTRGLRTSVRTIARNTVPTLILHGDADRILPSDASSRRQAKMIKNARFVELKGGPMACCGLMRSRSTPSW